MNKDVVGENMEAGTDIKSTEETELTILNNNKLTQPPSLYYQSIRVQFYFSPSYDHGYYSSHSSYPCRNAKEIFLKHNSNHDASSFKIFQWVTKACNKSPNSLT